MLPSDPPQDTHLLAEHKETSDSPKHPSSSSSSHGYHEIEMNDVTIHENGHGDTEYATLRSASDQESKTPHRTSSPPTTALSAVGTRIERRISGYGNTTWHPIVNRVGVKLKKVMLDDSETAEEEVEMMDYDNPEDHIHERKLEDDHNATSRNIKLALIRIFITVCIGVVIGLCGFFVSKAVASLLRANVNVLTDLMNRDLFVIAFFATMVISCSFAALSAFCVTFISWQTRGSGVGRLNAYLSGMYSGRFLNMKTLLAKVCGLILTVGAGIKQGMEGPFIHIGAMWGLQMSRGLIWIMRTVFGHCGMEKYTSIVSSVVDERMFISGGASAGFSVAFNAPIAGVLYVQDGAFSYWNGDYTMRTFICCMVAVTTINLCLASNSVLPTRGLIDLEHPAKTTITLQEFWGFLILGLLGGFMGSLFTKLNVECEKLRHQYLGRRRLHNVLDVLACTVCTVLLSFVLPFMFSCHTNLPSCVEHPERCLRFKCGPRAYSDMATLFFTLPEETIRILFERNITAENDIPYQILIVFCIFYFLMAAITYNMAVPGGLFIPSIIIGGAYGRLVGLMMANILPASSDPDLTINPGVYAVLGASSMLGGLTRMTLPITVMMIEITSDAQFLIPIMLVVLLSKLVADQIVSPLYQTHLRMDGIVMVFGDRPPRSIKRLTARDVMSRPPLVQLSLIETVENAYHVIRDTSHNAFPIISKSTESSHFIGLIHRRHLIYVLTSMPCFTTMDEARESEPMTATNQQSSSNVSAALMSSIGTSRPTMQTLNTSGASVSATFVEWCARQNPFGITVTPSQRDSLVQDQHDTAISPSHTLTTATGARATGIPNSVSLNSFPPRGEPYRAPSRLGPAATTTSAQTSPTISLNDDHMERDPILPRASPHPHSRHSHHTVRELQVQSDMYQHYVNLSPFVDQGSYIVNEETSARRVWSLFRSLGMRHIVVINAQHQPVGIITRRDLIKYAVTD